MAGSLGLPLIRRSALHAFHLSAGADMAENNGWHCPDSYGSVDAEVQAVSEQVGLSDISPLAKLDMQGNNAFAALVQWLSPDPHPISHLISHWASHLRHSLAGLSFESLPKPCTLTRIRVGCRVGWCVPLPGITRGSFPHPEQPLQSNPTLRQ